MASLQSPFFFFLTQISTTNFGAKTKTAASKFAPKSSNCGGGGDVNLKAALTAASIRFKESLRSDPLFIDPYAGCFLSSVTIQEMREPCTMETAASSPCYYSLATKCIDDMLLSLVSSSDVLRQIILLTDGMDTRPYRLSWPHSSVIYDISPERVFKEASQRLEGVGAKISKGCLLLHVSLETPHLQVTLCGKGLSGTRPSLWVLQGLPLMTLSKFEDVLSVVSSLAMEGCTFMGVLPTLLVEAGLENTCTKHNLVESLFMSHGFQVDVIEHTEITRNMQLEPPPGDYSDVLFIARQLRFSDAQMEAWRTQFLRLEEEAFRRVATGLVYWLTCWIMVDKGNAFRRCNSRDFCNGCI